MDSSYFFKKNYKTILSILGLVPVLLFFTNAVTPNVTANLTSSIPLIKLFSDPTTSAINSNYKALPKMFSDFPTTANGYINYLNGGAFPIGTSGFYQSGQSFSDSALLVLPPSVHSDFIKIIFTKPGQVDLDRNYIWYLSGKYGIQKAQPNVSQGVRVQIVVVGDPIDSTDTSWAVIDDFIVHQSSVTNRISNFGTWPLRKNFYFIVQASVVGVGNSNENLVIDGLSVNSMNQRPSLGIAQSNLIWDSNANSIISSISNQGSKWIRTNLSTSLNALNFANLVLASNQKNMNVLAVVMPELYEDYVDPISSLGNADLNSKGPFKSLCGYNGAPKVSMIDIGLFSLRLENNLKILKSVGAQVDAFEIGNELDWVCFNGDIQLGSKPIATNLPQQFFIKYGEMLKQSKQLIGTYFPNSKVLTFGAANSGLFGATDSYVQDPQNMLATLTFLNGINYLQYADAIGIHLYPASTNLVDISKSKSTILNYSSVSNVSKPIWITEWGFSSTSNQNFSGIRYSAIRSFIELVNTMPETAISNIFLYSFSLPGDSFSFVDVSGNLDPSIRILGQYRGLIGR